MATEIHLTDREADVMQVLWDHGPSVVNEWSTPMSTTDSNPK